MQYNYYLLFMQNKKQQKQDFQQQPTRNKNIELVYNGGIIEFKTEKNSITYGLFLPSIYQQFNQISFG